MKIGKTSVLTSLLICTILSACGPTQEQKDATVTQIAANVFATQTAQAPTATQTFTPSPTPTITPTPTDTPTSTPTSTPTDTPTPTQDPSILFTDNFSNTNSGWDEFSDANGGTEYLNGGYHIFVSTPDYYYWSTLDRSFSNVIIEVDAKKIGGPDNNEYGVLCRYLDSKNYYAFLIGSDAYYSIWKNIADKWTMVGGNDWGFNDKVINTGNQSNHLKVTCNGDNLILEVNGTTLMDVVDSTLTTGAIGLYAGAYKTAGVDILFDNFVVRKPK